MAKTAGKELDRQRQFSRLFFMFLVGTLLMTSACRVPVTVKRTDPRAVQRMLTGNVLSMNAPSLATQNILRQYLLVDRFEENPEEALAELRTIVL